MHIAKRPLSRHRRARIITWTLTMLVWMTQVIFAGAPFKPRHERQRGARMSLDHLTRTVKLLIISRAHDFVRRRPQRKRSFFYRGRDLTPRALMRAVVGSRVRQMLKRKSIGERIGVLIHALRHLDAYAALVANRLKRRFTRRHPRIPALAPSAALGPLAAPEACFADSS